MPSMTIHKMDELLAERIRLLAEERGESLNTTMKELLSQALGLPASAADARVSKGYGRFLGVWTEEDKNEFDAATADFERVDAEDWR